MLSIETGTPSETTSENTGCNRRISSSAETGSEPP